MDQVFDFRECFLTLLRRFKLLLILALVCGILGGLFGFAVKADGFSGDLRDTYTVTSVVSVNLNRQEKDVPLSSIMTTIDGVLQSNYFQTTLMQAGFDKPELESAVAELFPQPETTELDEFKKTVKTSIKGNLILVEVTAHSQQNAQAYSIFSADYIAKEISGMVTTVSMTPKEKQTILQNSAVWTDKLVTTAKFGILGAAGGFGLGILWIFFFNIFSLKIKSADDLKTFGLPVLGIFDQPKGGR